MWIRLFPRTKARRQVRAVKRWAAVWAAHYNRNLDNRAYASVVHPSALRLCHLERAIAGYYAAGDWVGVDVAYREAKRAVEQLVSCGTA